VIAWENPGRKFPCVAVVKHYLWVRRVDGTIDAFVVKRCVEEDDAKIRCVRSNIEVTTGRPRSYLWRNM